MSSYDKTFSGNFDDWQEAWGTDLKNWLFHRTDGPWAKTSKRFVEATTGEVRIMTVSPSDNSVLLRTELPTLLNKLENTNDITQIDGLTRNEILSIGESCTNPDKKYKAIRNALLNNAITRTHFSCPSGGNYTQFTEMTPDSLDTLMKNASQADMNNWHSYMSRFHVPKAATRVLNKLGPIGLVVGLGLTAVQAGAAELEGDHEGAKDIVASWALDGAGSTAGEIVGGAIAAVAIAAAAEAGVTISAPVAGALVLGATLFGGFFGSDTATEMYERFKNLDEVEKKGFFEQLSFVLFGDYTISQMELPEGLLQGNRITLDMSYTKTQIISNAETSVAWRYALKNLNTFVIEGDDSLYTPHNQNGELDLKNFSKEYLNDRAAMLEWRLKYDNGGKKYTEDWNTWKIEGDWHYIDHSISVGDGVNAENLTFRIDGVNPLTFGDHQIVFGSKKGENLDGGGLSDYLYGMGGNDTLIGGGGHNYLEGGEGHDKYVLSSGKAPDTIYDIDGDGEILFEGKKVSDTFYGMTGSDRYISKDNWVIFKRPDNSWSLGRNNSGDFYPVAILKNWKNRELDIKIEEKEYSKFINKSANNTYFLNINLRRLTHLNEETSGAYIIGNAKNSYLMGSEYDDKIESGGGHTNTIYGLGGNDHLLGGEGYDYIRGGSTRQPGEGKSDDDLIEGYGASDILVGGAGADRIYGLTKKYKIDTAASAAERDAIGDWISAEQGADICVGSTGKDFIFGGGGNDELQGGDGDDLLLGDAQYQIKSKNTILTNNVVEYEWDNTIKDIKSVSYPSTMFPQGQMFHGWDWSLDNSQNTPDFSFSSTLKFNRSKRIEENPGNDIIYGGAGNDFVAGQSGDDILYGGAGKDIIYGDDAVPLAYGQSGNDILHAEDDDQAKDRLYGGDGNDTLYGGTGGDLLYGENGDDHLYGHDENDDILDGGEGNDGYHSSGGNDVFVDSQGDDIYFFRSEHYDNASSITTITDNDKTGTLWLDGSQVDGKDLIRIDENHWQQEDENYILTLEGNNLVVTMWDREGKIVINNFGSAESKTLGIDLIPNTPPTLAKPLPDSEGIVGKEFNYTIDAGSFTDPDPGDTLEYIPELQNGDFLPSWLKFDDKTLSFSGIPPEATVLNITVKVSDKKATVKASDKKEEEAKDTFTVTIFPQGAVGSDKDTSIFGTLKNDLLLGGNGNEILWGYMGDDLIKGGAGDDSIFAGIGADTLEGGAGNDRLFAGIGDDIVNGGTGKNVLTGGLGKDTFLFSEENIKENQSDKEKVDTITDFNTKRDTLLLKGTLFTEMANEGVLRAENFHTSSDGKAADENDHIIYNTTSGTLFYDIDGNGEKEAVAIAHLANKANISEKDILIAAGS